MTKMFSPQVLTANRLRAGDVVYLGPGGVWITDLTRAAVARDAAQLSALEVLATGGVQQQKVVGVYAIDVELSGDKPAPRSVKETIRAKRGPTV